MLFLVPAVAHDLELFATLDENVIKGRVYLSDRPAHDVRVRLLDGNSEISSTTSDRMGQFMFEVGEGSLYRLIAETADGHRAEHVVQSDHDHDSHEVPELPHDDYGEAIRTAVRDAVRPLQEQIAQLERRTRTRDIVAGIGYIVGIAGLWVLLRRPRARS
jgi:nickel transport protein